MDKLYIIETKNLTKYFTASTNLIDFFPRAFSKRPIVKAVDGVNIKIEKGEIFGLLGPNGAGKTTLIKMLCSLIIPTKGEAYVNGFEIVKNGEMVRRSIGLVTGEERSFYWRLTGKQNLKFFGALYNMKSKEINKKIDYLVELLEMQEYIDIRFDEYSTGMKQHLAIARSLLSDAKILFMDEPTKSLDYYSANKLRQFIKERIVGQDKRTVFFTTHNLQEAGDFADRIALMDRGIIKACGTVSELKKKIKDPKATIGEIFEYFT
ncbi:MAG: ABC transporter ATP-binding protein [Candidatus Aminicenantia bacterium]